MPELFGILNDLLHATVLTSRLAQNKSLISYRGEEFLLMYIKVNKSMEE